jgi:hypothetical protein
MEGEIEVQQPMSEAAFTSCLPIHERLGQPAPKSCASHGGRKAERLIAGASGIVVKGAKSSCSIGEKASACGGCCAHNHNSPSPCPFG